MGSTNRAPLGLATAHFACATTGNRTISAGVICRTGWTDDNHYLGPPAVGDAPMLFVLKPASQRIDPRLILIAQTLGWSQGRIFWLVKCPLLVRPALIAFAVGFSVSIAQYMPTLWLGAGRYSTLTTEAVALSSGGSSEILATQALWQLLLPLLVFALAAILAAWIGRFRQGLR